MRATPVAVRRQRPAMGTWFEVTLLGDDPEHLEAVAVSALDEIVRVERLLSRFDPASEIARINRDAHDQALLIDLEMLSLLLICRDAWQETGGAFDPSATSLIEGAQSGGSFGSVELDPATRRIRLTSPGLAIDLGGIGKGYAIERAAALVATQGVQSAFLHGGTSSGLAIGESESGDGWHVAVRDPFSEGVNSAPLPGFLLRDRSYSCSSALAPGSDRSDVIVPQFAKPLSDPAACLVIASSAVRAEVLSTALLVMGRVRASEFLTARVGDDVQVAWMEPAPAGTSCVWLTESPDVQA